MTAYRLVFTSLMAMALSSGFANSAEANWGQWQNSLKPAGPAAKPVTLAESGETEYTIVIPEEPTPPDQKAADDLSRWLGKMTGAEFEIVKEPAPTHDREISIGRTQRLGEAEWSAPDELGAEGYAIGVAGDRIFLTGGEKRGPINAVHALLEEDLGCRWYTKDFRRIRRRPTVKVAIVPRSYKPVFTIRDPFYHDAFDGTWSLRNGTNAPNAEVPEKWGGHNNYALFVHSFKRLLPPDEYFDEHPEYFMLNEQGKRTPRQLCLTNPDTIRLVTENVLEILNNKPDAEIISVSKNDGGGSCVCPDCKAIDDREGTKAASLLHFVNKVAAAVEEKYPDKTVSTLAYLETVKPPKTIRPRDNVAIRLCTDRCMWSHPFTPAKDSEVFSEALEGWAAIHDCIHIWDYCVNFSHYTAPMPNMDVIASNIRYFAANNVRGVMEQGAYQSTGSERELMRCWVIAKLMWDPTLDTWDLMQDFIFGYYGPAALPIIEYNELLCETAEEHNLAEEFDHGIRYPMDAAFLSESFLRRATELFDRVEERARTKELQHRVELARIPIMYVKLCRGPEFVGDGYEQLINRFERIAKRESITRIKEGSRDIDRKVKRWRDDLRVHKRLQKIGEKTVDVAALPAIWRFAKDEENAGAKKNWFAVGFDDSEWATVRSDIDEGWEDQGFPDYTGYGWYRQTFEAPAELQDSDRVYLYFAAVDEDAVVYLNGKKVFEHTCESTRLAPEQIWLTPFAFEVTERLQYGEENTLAVKVYNRLGMGGVYKPVFLVASETRLDAPLMTALLEEKGKL